MKSPFEEVMVVLVIYNMKIAECPAYHSLTHALLASSKSAALFIYDNSPAAQEVPNDSTWTIRYIHDQLNPGVSKAYNQGFAAAKSEGKKWLLLADQDTLFPPHAIDAYEKSIGNGLQSVGVPVLKDQFGIISPFKFKWGGGRRVNSVRRNSLISLNDFRFINSGALISVQCYEQAGGYDEQLPLDFSDIDFGFRVSKIHDAFFVLDFECQHALGDHQPRQISDTLARFKKYLLAARAMSVKYPQLRWVKFRALLRAVKLSCRFKKFDFMTAYYEK